jgi:hypothetical protein
MGNPVFALWTKYGMKFVSVRKIRILSNETHIAVSLCRSLSESSTWNESRQQVHYPFIWLSSQ